MQRQRDGLVPIREVFGGLDGPVKALREASPQALHVGPRSVPLWLTTVPSPSALRYASLGS